MKSVFKLFLFAVLTTMVASSCKKTADYVAPVYACGCGNFTWKGANVQLLDANYIESEPGESLSRRYYITASIKSELEEQPHSVNFWIEIPDVEEGVFQLDDDTFEFTALAHEVNDNDEFFPLREFVPIEGVVTVNPAFLGGPETVSFNLIMREWYDEDLVGMQFAFAGSFTVNVPF